MILLKLQDIKKAYDVIIPCGSSCAPTIHLRRYRLRECSLPLDWVYSESLADVGRLIQNKFNGYMELPKLVLLEGTATFFDDDLGIQSVNTYFIKDTSYNVTSVHDFPILPNQQWYEGYPAFKEKLNTRIEKCNKKIAESNSILFIRWATNFKDALAFHNHVSSIAKHKFSILILNPSDDATSISELDWGINNLCVVQVPNRIDDNKIWDFVYEGISLN